MGRLYKVNTNGYCLLVETDCTDTVMRYMTDCTTGGNTPLIDIDLDGIEDTSSWETDCMYTPLAEFLTGDKFAGPVIAQHTDAYDILGVRDDWYVDNCYWYAVEVVGDWDDAETGSYSREDALELFYECVKDSDGEYALCTYDLGNGEPTCVDVEKEEDLIGTFEVQYLSGESRKHPEWDCDYMLCTGEFCGEEFELYAEADPCGHYENVHGDTMTLGEARELPAWKFREMMADEDTRWEFIVDDEYGTQDELKAEILRQAKEIGMPERLMTI